MIAEFAAGLVKGVYDVIKNNVHIALKNDSLKDHLVKNEVIQFKLNELLKELKADRIYLVVFHNGGMWATGSSMQRLSCIYEAVAPGVSPIMSSLQGKLVSEFPHLHNTLLQQNEYTVADILDMSNSDPAKSKWMDYGIRSLFITGVWDLNGLLIGDVALNYLAKTEITEITREDLKDFATAIAGYIAYPKAKEEAEDNITKLIVIFFALMFLSQTFYLLANIANWLNSIGPATHSIVKALFDLL